MMSLERNLKILKVLGYIAMRNTTRKIDDIHAVIPLHLHLNINLYNFGACQDVYATIRVPFFALDNRYLIFLKDLLL